jgi:hypothetical protein
MVIKGCFDKLPSQMICKCLATSMVAETLFITHPYTVRRVENTDCLMCPHLIQGAAS